MIELPVDKLENLNKLIESLDGDIIHVSYDKQNYLGSYESPFVACVSKKDESTHLLYLIEIIGMKCINADFPEVIETSEVSNVRFTHDGSAINYYFKTEEQWVESGVSIGKFIINRIDKKGGKESLSSYEQWLLEFMSIRELVFGLNWTLSSKQTLSNMIKDKNALQIFNSIHELKELKNSLMRQLIEVSNNYPLPTKPLEIYNDYPYPE